ERVEVRLEVERVGLRLLRLTGRRGHARIHGDGLQLLGGLGERRPHRGRELQDAIEHLVVDVGRRRDRAPVGDHAAQPARLDEGGARLPVLRAGDEAVDGPVEGALEGRERGGWYGRTAADGSSHGKGSNPKGLLAAPSWKGSASLVPPAGGWVNWS